MVDVPRGRLRPDLALYRRGDEPANRYGPFRVAPSAILEILSDDAFHDLLHKDEIYRQYGVTRRAYVDPQQRIGWWCRLDGTDHTAPTVVWRLDGWPELRLDRDALLVD